MSGKAGGQGDSSMGETFLPVFRLMKSKSTGRYAAKA